MKVDAAAILRRVRREVLTSLALVEQEQRNPRAIGQREALRYVLTVLNNETPRVTRRRVAR
jgi:hypothetical protein